MSSAVIFLSMLVASWLVESKPKACLLLAYITGIFVGISRP